MTTAPMDASPFTHGALFHHGNGELLDVALPFVSEGLDAGEAVAVALPPEQLELVRHGLGDDAPHVLFVDVTHLGRNPGRVLPELGLFHRAHGRHRRVRAFGSPVWPGRSPDELEACREHDALLNLALARAPVSVLCPFDVGTLEPETLAWARTTHPTVWEDGACGPNPHFGDPRAVAGHAAGPLPEPDDVGETLVFRAPEAPRTVRTAVAAHARRHGLDTEKVADLCLAAHEVAVNTIVHTSGPGILSLWTEADAVVCQVQDGGWIRDPLAGRHAPAPEEGRGYGLFLAHQICDLVRVHSHPTDGTTVRMWMRLPAPAVAALTVTDMSRDPDPTAAHG